MSLIAIALNLLLAGLLMAALALGLRLNRRLKVLRDSHDGFAGAVRDLNAAAARAEQGLADLRAATDEATDTLADRIEKGRVLAAKLERLLDRAPAAAREAEAPPAVERRLGALLARVGEARPERAPLRAATAPEPPPARWASLEEELFEAPPLRLHAAVGGRR